MHPWSRRQRFRWVMTPVLLGTLGLWLLSLLASAGLPQHFADRTRSDDASCGRQRQWVTLRVVSKKAATKRAQQCLVTAIESSQARPVYL